MHPVQLICTRMIATYLYVYTKLEMRMFKGRCSKYQTHFTARRRQIVHYIEEGLMDDELDDNQQEIYLLQGLIQSFHVSFL